MTASFASTNPSPGTRKAVHVSVVHPSTDIRIFHKQCRSLAAAGYQVTLFARADGPYEEDGVRVVPVPRPRSRAARMTVGVWSLLRPLLAERADIYHLHDPELIPLGLALRARGHHVVFDAHEPLPSQVMGKHYIPRPLRPAVAWGTRLLGWTAGRALSAIVAASPLVADVYARARRMVIVNNFPILDDSGVDIPYDERTRGLVYVGAITELRGLPAMLEAAKAAYAAYGEKLTLIGPFQPPELQERLSDPDVAAAVDYVGVQRPADARRLVAEAKVGLMVQVGPKAYENNLPTKIFEYMAEGVPVVASHFPLWRQIVEDAGAGVVVPPEDGQAVAEAVCGLLADPERARAMGERGRKAVHEKYSWEAEARTLLSLYDSLLSGESRATHAP
jgi:hypothetical protein